MHETFYDEGCSYCVETWPAGAHIPQFVGAKPEWADLKLMVAVLRNPVRYARHARYYIRKYGDHTQSMRDTYRWLRAHKAGVVWSCVGAVVEVAIALNEGWL